MKILSIAKVSFRELLRDKVFYSAIVIGFFLLFVSILISKLTFVSQDRIVLDFGVTFMQVTQAMLGVFLTAPLIAREIQRRTIQVVLSRPVSYLSFVLGKLLGVILILAINALALGAAVCLVLLVSDGRASITATTGLAFVGAFFQSVLISTVTLFFASFSTPGLASVLSISVYLVGWNLNQLEFLAAKSEGLMRFLLQNMAMLWPQFEKLSLGFRATYDLGAPSSFLLGILYVLGIGSFLVFVSSRFLQKREMG